MTEASSNTILKNSLQAILMLDHSWKIMYASDHIKKILGYSKKELIERNFFEILYTEIGYVHKKNIQQFKRIIAGRNFASEAVMVLKHKKGHTFPSAITAINLLHDKYINGIVITIKITQKIRGQKRKGLHNL